MRYQRTGTLLEEKTAMDQKGKPMGGGGLLDPSPYRAFWDEGYVIHGFKLKTPNINIGEDGGTVSYQGGATS